MSSILSYSAIAFTAFGVVFSVIYLWLHLFSDMDRLDERNRLLLSSIRYTIFLSLLFALLSFLLGKTTPALEALNALSRLFAVITICWIIVMLLCGISIAIIHVGKGSLRETRVKAVRKAFFTAFWAVVISGFLTWLLS